MTRTTTPALSVVVATDSLAAIRKLLARLRPQGDPGRIEIVVAALAGGAGLNADAAELASFPHVRIAEVDDAIDLARAELAGFRAATADYVVFAETCSYPRPGFVNAILGAARSGEWAVIGPAMANANPDSATSWAGMWINYGPFVGSKRRGPATLLPGHDSAYQRRALLSLGNELEPLIQSLTAVQQELRARGFRLFREPGACAEVLNISRPGWYLVDQFGKGRQFAALRGHSWSLVRRLLYFAGSPLIPVIRFLHTVAALRSCGLASELWHLRRALLLASGLVAGAAGEMVGYAFGGHATPDFHARNLYRPKYLRRQDTLLDSNESRPPSVP